MKYIRTKDGIYDFEKSIFYYSLSRERKIMPYCKEFEENPDNCKVADTIEELCDSWIIIPIWMDCNPFVRNIKDNIQHFINYNHIIYAAIWVRGDNHEPILKPVAKMNDKGGLELL